MKELMKLKKKICTKNWSFSVVQTIKAFIRIFTGNVGAALFKLATLHPVECGNLFRVLNNRSNPQTKEREKKKENQEKKNVTKPN